MKVGDIVEVHWKDSAVTPGWLRDLPDEGIARCKTSGYLARHDSKEIIVALSRGEENWGQILAIPRACILKVRKLR